MARLTNGEVSYERNVKLADYESKKFSAKFSFVLEDGDDADAVAEVYGRQIVRFVEDKLGLKSSIEAPAGKATLAPPQQAKAEIAAPTEPEVKKAAASPKRAKKDTTASVPETVEAAPQSAPASEVQEITDEQLQSAITKQVTKTGNPNAVRHFVQTLMPKKPDGTPWASRELPQERRQEFLDGLPKVGIKPAPVDDTDNI